MQAPTERHLLRRQQYFAFMLQDILYHAYQRSVEIGRNRQLAESDYTRLFQINMPDISRADNESLARAGRDIASTFQTAAQFLNQPRRADPASPNSQSAIPNSAFSRLALKTIFKFLGDPQPKETINQILTESGGLTVDAAPIQPAGSQ
jgi:hypothetical protein